MHHAREARRRRRGRAEQDVSTKEGQTTLPAARMKRIRKLLQSLERWLRTSPRQISLLVVLMTAGTLFVQDHVKQHLWLVFTYSFPVALAGYGLGLQGGVATALVVTALLYDHAVGTLHRSDTVF